MALVAKRFSTRMCAFVVRQIMLRHLRQHKLRVVDVSLVSSTPLEWELLLRWEGQPHLLSLTIQEPLPLYESGPQSDRHERLMEALLRGLFRPGTPLTRFEILTPSQLS